MPTAFHDVVLDLREPFGMTVTTTRRVSVVTLASGHEARNARTAFALRRYLIPFGPRPMAEVAAIAAFFDERGGPLHAFRFRDPSLDSTAVAHAEPGAGDIVLGAGDGGRTRFALVLGSGRPITRPRPETLQVAVAGTVSAPGAFFLDQGGVIAFAEAPPPGALVTAGCRFDLPVRFENETLSITRNGPQSAGIDDLVLREVIE